MRRFIQTVALVLLLATVLCGCNVMDMLGSVAGDKDFTCMELTMKTPALMVDITEDEINTSFDFVLSSNTMAIFGLRESFESLADLGELTVEDYAKLVVEANGFDSEVTTANGLTTFSYEADGSDGVPYTYLAGVYQASEAFWMVQIACPTENYAEKEADLLGYLSSVTFA